MVGAGHSIRLRVDFDSKKSIVFSYPELLKRHEKTIQQSSSLLAPSSTTLDQEQDSYYLALLERAAKYDLNPGDEEVDSGTEDATPNRDGKPDEYDYEDPFIDDSDMMLDEPYAYSPLDDDGFFVYHGALDGPIIPLIQKKKSTVRKYTATGASTTETATRSTGTAAKPTSGTVEASPPETTPIPNQQLTTLTNPIEISDSEDNEETEDEMDNPKITINPAPLKGLFHVDKSPSPPEYDNNTKGKQPIRSSYFNTPTPDIHNVDTASSCSASSTTSIDSQSVTFEPITTLPLPDTSATNHSPSIPFPTTTNYLQPLTPKLEVLMDELRQGRQMLSFEEKSKFPPSLRLTMLKIGSVMFDTFHKVNDNVVAHLVTILPYNRYTMRKYLVTKSGPSAVNRFQQEIDKLKEKLTQAVNELMPLHIQEYEKKVSKQQTNPEWRNSPPIERKFKCSLAIRKSMYDILTLHMHTVSLSNEIATLMDKPGNVVPEKRARRDMYIKLLTCWPEPWMTTYDISRHYSGYKLKMKNYDDDYATKINAPSFVFYNGHQSDINQTNRTAVKRSASPSALSSSPNVSQSVQMDTCWRGDDKRQKSSMEPDHSTGGKDINNIIDLISTSLAVNINGMAMNEPNGPPSSPSTHKSSFMNISSLITKP
ncbi:hypothetical protein BC941DRAFT_139985 [Chlamydoabsidia padenii]|nr:hypothetical protein BC941DRAFT_139985 [Chlamydoabsidia padenii]